MELESSHAYLDGPHAVMEQTYRFGSSRVLQRISLTSASGQVDFETTVDWQDPAHMLRVRFPVAVKSPEAWFEIPFGSIARSTSESNLIEKAQLEVPAQQWVDLSQADYGVALLNDCKYGFRVKGHTLDMNLIRSVPHSGAPLVDKIDNTAATGNYGDLGQHKFRYAILPHANGTDEAALTRAARAFNTPLHVVPQDVAISFRVPLQVSFFSSDNDALEIAAVKRAEDGYGWITRLVNVTASSQRVQLQSTLGFTQVKEVDLIENDVDGADRFEVDGGVLLELKPFEIKALQFQ